MGCVPVLSMKARVAPHVHHSLPRESRVGRSGWAISIAEPMGP